MDSLKLLIVIVIAILIILLLPTLVTSPTKQSISNLQLINAITPTSINETIYVIGPQSLVQDLIRAGISKSLIKLITLDQLADLPNNSVIIIDWSVIKPSILIRDSGNNFTIDLVSLVIHELASAIARGDIVGIYVNGDDEGVAEFVLTYSWAVAVNNKLLTGPRSPIDVYLMAYPVIPVNSHESVIIMAMLIRPRGLVIGPIYPSQLLRVIANVARPMVVFNAINIDPCYMGYWLYAYGRSLSKSVNQYIITSDSFSYVWTATMFANSPVLGVLAYVDGNGTYYWDTCLTMFNIFAETITGLHYFTVNVLGYESYLENSTMYYNNGYVDSQLGTIDYHYSYQLFRKGITNALVADVAASAWDPLPANGVTHYGIPSLDTATIVPFIGVVMTMPPGTSENIINFPNPPLAISLSGVSAIQVFNITWIFKIDHSAKQQLFSNGFEDTTPANMFMQSLSSPNIAMFNVDFENRVVTAWFLCSYKVTQVTWARVTWVIITIPQASTEVIMPKLTVGSNAPPESYINGVVSHLTYTLCRA